MNGLRGIIVVALIHSTYASLTIKGPSKPVLEGDTEVQLECLFSGLNSSQVHFEHFSKYQDKWVHFEEPYTGFRCFRYSWSVEREESRVLFTLQYYASSYLEGRYRCVYDGNSSTGANPTTSETLNFKVHYMRKLKVYRGGMSRYLGSVENLSVPLGSDVELDCSTSSSENPVYSWQRKQGGEDWMLPSFKLKLTALQASDGGQYTCVAQHPSVASLRESQTVNITVLSEEAAWYESTNGFLMLMTSAAAAALLVLILTMSVYMCRRGKQPRSSKGPIDDHSQTKPIYKASVESLPSTCGDKQPLV